EELELHESDERDRQDREQHEHAESDDEHRAALAATTTPRRDVHLLHRSPPATLREWEPMVATRGNDRTDSRPSRGRVSRVRRGLEKPKRAARLQPFETDEAAGEFLAVRKWKSGRT